MVSWAVGVEKNCVLVENIGWSNSFTFDTSGDKVQLVAAVVGRVPVLTVPTCQAEVAERGHSFESRSHQERRSFAEVLAVAAGMP